MIHNSSIFVRPVLVPNKDDKDENQRCTDPIGMRIDVLPVSPYHNALTKIMFSGIKYVGNIVHVW